MLGAIAGDIVGSVYEGQPCHLTTFPLFGELSRFTDDTVLTVATAHCLLHGTGYAETYRRFGREHPDRGYGPGFRRWLYDENAGPRYSCGNGSAMRVSPIGFAFRSVDETLAEAKRSAEASHAHPEAVKGAQAVALTVFMARNHASRVEIREEIAGRFGYDLGRGLNEIRGAHGARPDLTCQGSVPEAIVAFLASDSVEGAIRNAVSLGGDSDTQACIAGGIAEAACGGVPEPLAGEVFKRLPQQFTAVVHRFYRRFAPDFIRWGVRHG
jgi:ADP-ribosylglycohydrolase